MAANLVSVVMQFLTPDMIAKIASALGLDRSRRAKGNWRRRSRTACESGGRRCHAQWGSPTQQYAGAATDLGRSRVSKASSAAQARTRSRKPDRACCLACSAAAALDTMAQSIGKFAGLDGAIQQVATRYARPCGPRDVGSTAAQRGPGCSGLASLLGSQKDQIAAAIPSGLADQLSAAGLIDRAAGSLRSGAAAASAAGSRIAGASERTVAGTSRAAYATTSAASSQWPYWLAALAVLGGLAWYALGRPAPETVAELPRPAATQPATGTVGLAASDLTIGGVNLANQVNSSVGALRSVLPTITDAASAQAALPKLREATAQLNEVGNLAAKLTPEGKSALAKLIAAATPTINQMCDKVLATPGVGDIAKPAIDELRARLDTLSRA